MSSFQELREFVNRAEHNRKYPTNTASGMKAALQLFEAELNPEEKESLDKVREDLTAIYQAVFSRNSNKYTANSLETYKARLIRAMNDYKKYGNDPTAFANWRPTVVTRTRKSKQPDKLDSPNPTSELGGGHASIQLPDVDKYEISLSDSKKAIIITPKGVTKLQVERLIDYLTYLKKYAREDSNVSSDQNGGVA